MRNIVAAFFIFVIILTFISLLPSENQTGYFFVPSKNKEAATAIIIISIFIVFLMLIPRKNYSP